MRNFRHNQHGATMIEYAVIMAVIGLVLLVGLSQLGGGTGGIFTNLAAKAEQNM